MLKDINKNVFKNDNDENITLYIRQTFENVDHFRRVLIDYVIQEGFAYDFIKSDSIKIMWHYSTKDFTWRI